LNDLISLLQQIIHLNTEMRSSAISLIQHCVLCPFGNKSKAQLRRKLSAEKIKNEILAKQLENAENRFKSLTANVM
jgi:wee1-like protein kinase